MPLSKEHKKNNATPNIKWVLFFITIVSISGNILILFSGDFTNSMATDHNANNHYTRIPKSSVSIHSSPEKPTLGVKQELEEELVSTLTTPETKGKDYDDVLKELDLLSKSKSGSYPVANDNEEESSQQQQQYECPSPLKYYPNRIVRSTPTVTTTLNKNQTTMTPTTASLIPRIIHMSWKSRCLTRDQLATIQVWEQTFPTHSIFLHDDEAVSFLINSQRWPEFPDFHRALKCVLFKGAMRIDIWRVLITYRYGGIYTDIDNAPGIRFQNGGWDAVVPSDISAFFISDSYSRPTQNWYAIQDHHPMMYLALLEIIKNIFQMPNIHKPKVVFVTGPHAMAQSYYNFLAPRCCNGTLHGTAVYANNVVLKGMLGLSVLKRSNEKGKYVIPKPGYGDVVPYNATLNVTRRERIAMDTGVAHWQEAVRWVPRGRRLPCLSYLAKLEEGRIGEIPWHDA